MTATIQGPGGISLSEAICRILFSFRQQTETPSQSSKCSASASASMAEIVTRLQAEVRT